MKRLLSYLLVLTFTFSCTIPCFATTKKVIFDDDEYIYNGDFIIGKNKVNVKDEIHNYYLFTPDKDGLYGFFGENIGFISIVEKANNKEYMLKECFTLNEGCVVRLKTNEQCVITIGPYIEEEMSLEINICYLGEIESINLVDGQNAVLNHNVENIYYEDEYYNPIFLNCRAKFTEVSEEFLSDYLITTTPITYGEITVDIDCCGKSVPLKLDIKSIDNFIKSVLAAPNYNANGPVTYDNKYHGDYPEYVIINYNNGSSEKVYFDEFQGNTLNVPGLSDEVYAYLYFDNCQLILRVADKEYYLGIKAKNADIITNSLYLGYRIGLLLSSTLLLQYYIITEENLFLALKAYYSDKYNSVIREISAYRNANYTK